MSDTNPRVFISYAHESEHLSAWVLRLADRLRSCGVDCRIDQYEAFPSQGWRGWMSEQLRHAQHVLMVCTAEYRRRFDSNTVDSLASDVGRGVFWESQHITQQLYDDKFRNDARFVPILPPDAEEHFVPDPLKGYPKYRPDTDDGYVDLLRVLTGQHHTPKPSLGPVPILPVKPRIDPAQTPLPAGKPDLIANPYPGLAAFQPYQAANFFGRDDDSERVARHIMARRLACVVGASGTGKSSLATAGVLPRLQARLPGLICLRFTPQADPVAQLARAIDAALPEQRVVLGGSRQQRLTSQLLTVPTNALASLCGTTAAPLLLLADQFEELFTQAPPASAEQFRSVLDAALALPHLHVLLTLRSEFMHRLMDWLGGERFALAIQPLDAISQTGRMRQLIEQPALRVGVAVQASLVDQLIADLIQLRALPLLALTLRRLFDQRDGAEGLTLAAYLRMGGLASAVSEAARELDAQVDASPELAVAAERLFAHLATVVDDLPTRRTAPVAQLRTDAEMALLVDGLRGCGFLADPDDAHVELAHEALLKHWPRLAQWCERCNGHLAQRRQAEQAAQDWARSGHLPALRWGWERQEPALLAMRALVMAPSPHIPNDIGNGIAAWHVLRDVLNEPLRTFLHPEPLALLNELSDFDTSHQRREEIGMRLHQIGDPRQGVGLRSDGLPDIEWLPVGPGEVMLETDSKSYADRLVWLQHEGEAMCPIEVEAFEISRYPVTWKQYRAFIDSPDGFQNPRWWQDLACEPDHRARPGDPKWAFDSHPVVNVSWYDAMAFCHWLSDRLGQLIRLPTEWEWQWAAKSGEPGDFPWPGEWDPARANSYESGIGRTVAVGMYPAGRNQLGVDDLAGNVWEWCITERDWPRRGDPTTQADRTLRGGSWSDSDSRLRIVARLDYRPSMRYGMLGFRLCRTSSAGNGELGGASAEGAAVNAEAVRPRAAGQAPTYRISK